MKEESICIYHHLGLGDCIECNGMVRYFADKYRRVDILAKSNYYDMISYMYRDNKAIVVNKINKENEKKEASKFIQNYTGKVLVPGHSTYFANLPFFKKKKYGPAESFYHIANIPWETRNQYFFVERDNTEENRVLDKLNPKKEKFIFIHDDKDRGFEIKVDTNLKIIRNDITENMFFMIKLLEEAEEIHCMSSSMLCLIDCISSKTSFKKLFLHYDVRKVELGPKSLFADWEIL